MKKLTDDISALRPTLFPAVPRVLERMQSGIQAKLKAKPWLVRTLVGLAMRWKSARIAAGVPLSRVGRPTAPVMRGVGLKIRVSSPYAPCWHGHALEERAHRGRRAPVAGARPTLQLPMQGIRVRIRVRINMRTLVGLAMCLEERAHQSWRAPLGEGAPHTVVFARYSG